MSVLIRGMEMPHDCPHCEFAAIGYVSPMSSDCTLYCRAVDKFKDCATEILKDKPYEVISHYNDRPDWCPLLPLPEGHGDLIEKAEAYDRIMEQEGGNYIDMDSVGMGLEECQIFVPAEGGIKNGN